MIEFKIQNQKDLDALNQGSKNPMTADEIHVCFGKGEFYITRNVSLFFDGCKKVSITGCGKDTIIYFGNKTNFEYDPDSVIKISGSENVPVSANISDLVIRYDSTGKKGESLPEATTDWKLGNENGSKKEYLIKCYFVKGFTMTNVETELNDVICTNLDFRDCEDVEIHDCRFVNNSLCREAGCVWMRGNVVNVSVHDNEFCKYGNDELFAVWNDGKKDDSNLFEDIYVTQRNICFCRNKVYYKPNGEDVDNNKWDGLCNVLLTVSSNQGLMVIEKPGDVGSGGEIGVSNGVSMKSAIDGAGGTVSGSGNEDGVQHICYTTVSDIELCDNEIFVGAPVNQVLRLAFDRYTSYSEINVRGNKITHSDWSYVSSGENTMNNRHLTDFAVYYDMGFAAEGCRTEALDTSFCNEPIMICDNTILSDFKSNKGDEDEAHVCVDAGGVNVWFEHNTVRNRAEMYSDGNNSLNGIILLQSFDLSSRFYLRDNTCSGLNDLASVRSKRKSVFVEITAVDNDFAGDTRIYCRDGELTLPNLTLNFFNNKFCSDYPVFFLQGFSKKGVVRFRGNYVERCDNRVVGYGQEDANIQKGVLVYSINLVVDSMLVDVKDNVFMNLTQDDSGDFGKNIYCTMQGKDNMTLDNVTLKRSGNYYRNSED